MGHAARCFVITVAAFLVPQPAVFGLGYTPVHADNPTLRASLERIARGSALWRAELETIRQSGRQAVVLTPDAVVVVDDAASTRPQPFDKTVLAEISLVRPTATKVDAVLVVVNVPLLTKAHDRRGSSDADREADLDRILIHELYGHAFPYLAAGDISGRCPDPEPGQRADEACAIVRENAVRAELNLGRRTDYSLDSLSLARPSYWLGRPGERR